MNSASSPATNAAGVTPPRMVSERLSDQLAAWVTAQIEAGTWGVGQRLPTEQQLAATHGVSRTVVREAMHQLRSQGLLIARQGSGVFVAPPAVNRPLAFDPSVLESIETVAQIVEVRGAIEGEIAGLAAERATPDQVAALRRALDAIEAAAAAGRDGVEEDLAFHRLIAQATANPQFSRLLGFLEQYLREAMRVTRANEARRLDFAAAVRAEHAAIVEAIAAGDPLAARQAAAAHMRQGARRLELGGVVAARLSPRQRPTGRSDE